MVSAKKLDYLEEPAIGVYFVDMTQHVQQLRLESKLLEETNRNLSLESYTSTMSHEFRTPLSTSLMLIEQLIHKNSQNLDKSTLRIFNLIISQLNFLLCMVNDVLDLKQIESSQYQPKTEIFNPVKILEFIIAIFQPQSKM